MTSTAGHDPARGKTLYNITNPPHGAACQNAPYLYKSLPHGRAFKPLPGRGGARNLASRRTTTLSEADARKIMEATERAVGAGLPFNRFVTLHWEKAGVGDGLSATGRYLKLAGDWARSRGGRLAWVWVREGGWAKGEHVHILMHLAPNLAAGFNRRQRGWLKACGAAWRRGVLRTRPIGYSLAHALNGGDDYTANLRETLDYILKGVSAATGERLGIRRCEPSGELVGKRAGISQNIGRGGIQNVCQEGCKDRRHPAKQSLIQFSRAREALDQTRPKRCEMLG